MDHVELFSPAGEPVTTTSLTEATRLRAAGYSDTRPFIPAEHTVLEVESHLAEHPDEAAAVLAAEAATKARKTLVGGSE